MLPMGIYDLEDWIYDDKKNDLPIIGRVLLVTIAPLLESSIGNQSEQLPMNLDIYMLHQVLLA